MISFSIDSGVREFEHAFWDLFNGQKLEPDNPNNEAVVMQMSICGQKIKLRENPQMAPIQPYEVPNYYEEYMSKFGIGDRNSISILEPVIRMSHENISVIFQKLQICPNYAVYVYIFLFVSHTAQVECQPLCLLHSVMQFQNQNKFQTTGAYLQ